MPKMKPKHIKNYVINGRDKYPIPPVYLDKGTEPELCELIDIMVIQHGTASQAIRELLKSERQRRQSIQDILKRNISIT
jgi:hypothetical protein